MKTMSVSEFKTHFTEVMKSVLAGEEIGITSGKKKEVVTKIIPETTKKATRRNLGILEGVGTVKFAPYFKMTEEDFCM